MGLVILYLKQSQPRSEDSMGIFDFLTGGEDPSREANRYYDQIEGKTKPYYDPYINAGRSSLDDLMKQYGMLMSDPGSLLSKLGAGYKESPGYQFERNQGLTGINNAAAAGGFLGTMGHQQNAGELSTQLANKDFGDYMRQALGLYGTGLQGKQGINEMGFNASTGFAGNLADILAQKGGIAAQSAMNKNKGWQDLLSSLISGGAYIYGKK